MKKILFVIQIMTLSALIAPTYAGAAPKKGHKESKTVTREKKQKDLDWANYSTEQQFEMDFPKATDVNWYQGYFAEATFNDGSTRKTAYYDIHNQLVGTTNEVAYSSLPEKARKAIEKNFPGYKVVNVIYYRDNPDNDTDMYLYSTFLEDQDSDFAAIQKGSKEELLKIDSDGQVSFLQNL